MKTRKVKFGISVLTIMLVILIAMTSHFKVPGVSIQTHDAVNEELHEFRSAPIRGGDIFSVPATMASIDDALMHNGVTLLYVNAPIRGNDLF